MSSISHKKSEKNALRIFNFVSVLFITLNRQLGSADLQNAGPRAKFKSYFGQDYDREELTLRFLNHFHSHC